MMNNLMRFIIALALALTAGAPTYGLAFTVPVLIVNRNSGMCVEPTRGKRTADISVSQQTCLDIKRQRWKFRARAGGYEIVNAKTNTCITSPLPNGALTHATCSGAQSQIWEVETNDQWVGLRAAGSAECLDITASSIDETAKADQEPCDGRKSQQWTLSLPGPKSEWSQTIQLPLVPVAAATLRNGKILMWASHDNLSFGIDQGETFTSIFDPQTLQSTTVLVSNTGHDMFCPGTATLPDGKILVNGGSSSSKTSIYDPETNTWSAAAEMKVPRGYQGDTPLGNGDVLTVGGSWSGDIGDKVSEIWNPSRGWRLLPNIHGADLSGPDPAGPFRADNHMWLFAWSDRYVLHAGPSADMHWLDMQGDGAILPAGARGDDVYAMNGNIAMVGPAKLLKIGGAPAYEDLQASDAAYTISYRKGPYAPVEVVKQGHLTFPRAFANAVTLPGGQVVVIGGSNVPRAFSDLRAVMMPELWSPGTGRGTFQRLAPISTPRTYHSIAVLMKDARVFVGGGGLCGVTCNTNHMDAQILTPPYLFNSDGALALRPSIVSAPVKADPGDIITVTTDTPVASFSLNRLAAVTHSLSNDQRALQLEPVSADGLEYRLKLPSDRAGLLAGDWMLFALDGNGVPSIAVIIRIQ